MRLLDRERPAATNNLHNIEPSRLLKRLTDRQPASSGVRTRRRYGTAAALLAVAIGVSACTPGESTGSSAGTPAQPPATEAPAAPDPAPPQPSAPQAPEDPAPPAPGGQLVRENCDQRGNSEWSCPRNIQVHIFRHGDDAGVLVDDVNPDRISRTVDVPVNTSVPTENGASCVIIFTQYDEISVLFQKSPC